MIMKNLSYIILTIIACSTLINCGDRAEKKESKLREEAFSVAVDYARGQLSDAREEAGIAGAVIISGNEKKYIIEPAKVFTGLINDDDEPDAIVTITSVKGQFVDLIEHLFLISSGGKLMLIRSVESDMKVLRISNGIITAQVPTHPRTSPLYNCASCQEIINYRFINGILEKTE